MSKNRSKNSLTRIQKWMTSTCQLSRCQTSSRLTRQSLTSRSSCQSRTSIHQRLSCSFCYDALFTWLPTRALWLMRLQCNNCSNNTSYGKNTADFDTFTARLTATFWIPQLYCYKLKILKSMSVTAGTIFNRHSDIDITVFLQGMWATYIEVLLVCGSKKRLD